MNLRSLRSAGVLLVFAAALRLNGEPRPAPKRPGTERGVTLLPNGWRIAPAGRHMNVADLPLAMVESPDGRYLVVTNNGYVKPSLTVVDLKNFLVKSRGSLENAWLGLAWSADAARLYSSGAAANTVEELLFEDGRVKKGSSIPISEPDKKKETFIGGVAVRPGGA